MKKKDRYLKIVEWSDEDQCYVGSVPGWIGKCCHGDNEEDVYHQLCQILDEWIEIYEEDKNLITHTVHPALCHSLSWNGRRKPVRKAYNINQF